MYICVAVDPPHCRALTSITRIGNPAIRISSYFPISLLCPRFSLKGMGLLVSLS